LKRPVFRTSVWTTNGWVKSKTELMTYSKYAFYLNRLSQDAGFKNKLTSYCFRRGYTNAINRVFNKVYNNQAIRFNIQDAYLESDITDNRLTRAFTYISIRYNPGALKKVPREVINKLLVVDLEITVFK
ncbi:hypothetical protein DL98DRAFT_440971, partial [Cadophora sp. DSE1049]